jgi:electron transfer flavoprotein beta subunit
VKIRVKSDNSGVETEHVKMSLNPFDEIALEEALRLKEKNIITETVAVSIGPTAASETLRTALARGADKAILVAVDPKTDQDGFSSFLEPLNVAKILKKMVLDEKIDLVILGKQAIDDDCNQTGQMLAGLLGWSQGTFASKLEFKTAEKKVEVTREVDGGLETLLLSMPAVITVDLRLNEPRYISLPNVMKAKSKPLTVIKLSEVNSDLKLKQHVKVLKVEAPVMKRKNIMVKTAQELVEKLVNDAKVI